MEGFNEQVKSAAVGTYSPLHKDGKNEAEIKGAITEDANGFTPDQVAEIYQAIIAVSSGNDAAAANKTNTETKEEKPKVKKGGFVVIQQFRDKNDFDKIFEVGDDVSKLDTDRLERLVKLKVVEKVK